MAGEQGRGDRALQVEVAPRGRRLLWQLSWRAGTGCSPSHRGAVPACALGSCSGAQSTSTGPLGGTAWAGYSIFWAIPSPGGDPAVLLACTHSTGRALGSSCLSLQGKELLGCHSCWQEEWHSSPLQLPGTGLVVVQCCPHCRWL